MSDALIYHTFVSPKGTHPDPTIIDGPKFNDAHDFTRSGNDGDVLVRRTAGATKGAAWEPLPAADVTQAELDGAIATAAAGDVTTLASAQAYADALSRVRVLTSNVTVTGTDANTTEKTLWTYSLPAGTLNVDGRAVRITAYGTTAANANSKTIRLFFGATQIAAKTNAANNAAWTTHVTVLRTGATAQVAGGTTNMVGTPVDIVTTPAETLSGAVTISITGQNAVASANDIVIKGVTVELM